MERTHQPHPQPTPRRRLVAAGIIRRAPEPKQDRQARIAELHRLCREDYVSNATRRTLLAAIDAERGH